MSKSKTYFTNDDGSLKTDAQLREEGALVERSLQEISQQTQNTLQNDPDYEKWLDELNTNPTNRGK